MQPISKVEQRYAEEVIFLRDTLARETKERDAAMRAFEKATDAWWKAASKDFDAPETAKEAKLRVHRDKVMAGWQRHEARVTIAADKLAAFDNEAAKERYISDRERKQQKLEELHETEREERAARPPRAPKNELTDDLSNRIVEMVKGGMGITTVAKTLNEEGTPPPGRAKSWYAVTVHGIVKNVTGKAVSELRS